MADTYAQMRLSSARKGSSYGYYYQEQLMKAQQKKPLEKDW